ncbi:MAG: hypothetical protein MUE94_12180 [Verrucomicrobia bacterium]|nr:hypothetical protein [Verrucomicrobiota bacterium]
MDFILEQDGKLVAVEIKASQQVNVSDAAGIQTLKRVLTRKRRLVRGVVLHAGKARPLGNNVIALPWGWLVESTNP